MKGYLLYVVPKRGQFLMAKKLQAGYFFGDNIVREGQRLNQAGLWVLPGGRREHDDKDLKAAVLREFKEETGIDFPPGKVDELFEYKSPSRKFGAMIYSGKSREVLREAADEINKHLEIAAKARADIISRKIQTATELRDQHPGCPDTDELERVEVWDLNSRVEEIRSWQNTRGPNARDWFYYILESQLDFE